MRQDGTTDAEGIYDSPEALDAYLADVRERRERRRDVRRKLQHLEEAIARVETEFALAREEGDAEIAAELESVLAGFRARLAPLGPSRPAQEPAAPPVMAVAEAEGRADAEDGPEADRGADRGAETVAPAPPTLSDAERAALAGPFRERLASAEERWHTLDAEGLGGREGPALAACLRVRVVACSVGQVLAEARAAGVGADVAPAALELRDRIDVGRYYAGDAAPCLPFDEAAWGAGEASLDAEEWAGLGARYARTAEAAEAYRWCAAHPARSGAAQLHLLNAIAAVQQGLYRALESHGGSDKLQTELYGSLRDTARDAGYLSALSSEISLRALDELAERMPGLLAAAQREAAQAEEREQRLARRGGAVAAVESWRAEREQAPAADRARLDGDLYPLLDECLDAGVPTTDRRVRAALLESGPRLLAAREPYARILEAVLAERKRQGLDAAPAAEPGGCEGPEEELSDAAIEQYRQVVAGFAQGQRILILGGVPRQRVCDELKEVLGAEDVQWVASKKSDKAARFQAQIRRSNVLLLVKNYAGHDMSEMGREWMKAADGHFILLPSGYGVNQIIHQLYRYVCSRDGRV